MQVLARPNLHVATGARATRVLFEARAYTRPIFDSL